ncbi:MAG TPA: PaaI family thioesterase [Terriglobales bacterium]|nr:PaaI family thioesterase [Terriglobales bacterium]
MKAIPEALKSYFAALEEIQHAARPDDTYHHCFGCGPGHPTGLQVRCFKTDAGVATPVWIAKEYEGPPGAAHGGIVAAYLDEILAGAVVRGAGRGGVTGELTVRYRRPVPTERALLGKGRMVEDHGRYVDVEGEIVDPATQDVLASAKGRFFPPKAG